ncbi:hypothetical protein [Aurantiacibacter rhizosphaerae]|uniref:Lipoprotein n=1 Tax=Aurantiacibacter rhizosphaerae TaxID=2691582 RepID=A0A844XH37_9SPHN|nr:hypothetical protein [Aurantiacibacter rhizosphaerae]MWV29150.1 hypothetical protein [Aurantiacibacter rhizosphaerae]
MSFKFSPLLVVPLALSGCNSLPEPGYDPPDEKEAITAFKAANTLDAEILTGLEIGELTDLPIAIELVAPEWSAGWDTMQRSGSIAALRNSNKAYDRVLPSNCEWGWVDPEEVRRVSEPRVAGDPFPAWRCDVEVFLTQQHNIKAKGTARGYFYQTQGAWMYVGHSTENIVRDHDRMAQAAALRSQSRRADANESDWGN